MWRSWAQMCVQADSARLANHCNCNDLRQSRECRKAPCAANQGHARGNSRLQPDNGYTGAHRGDERGVGDPCRATRPPHRQQGQGHRFTTGGRGTDSRPAPHQQHDQRHPTKGRSTGLHPTTRTQRCSSATPQQTPTTRQPKTTRP